MPLKVNEPLKRIEHTAEDRIGVVFCQGLGLTVSDEFASRAEVFNDNLTRAKGRLMAFARDAVEPAIAGLNRLFASMEQGDRKRLDF